MKLEKNYIIDFWLLFVIFFVSFYLFFSFISVKGEENSDIDYNYYIKQQDLETINFISKNSTEESKKEVSEIKKFLETKYSPKEDLTFVYNPENFKNIWEISSRQNLISQIFKNQSFLELSNWLVVELNQQKIDVRWRMNEKTIKIFWVDKLETQEFFSVFMHEFWHFVDINFLEKKVLFDTSDTFYNISWESTKTMKKNMSTWDFVSWYAMTNKYEDFAESFNYYVLFNSSFFEKAQKSEALMNKYLFFWKYIFRKNEFKSTDFSQQHDFNSYTWDTTKVNIFLKNFLYYLKK